MLVSLKVLQLLLQIITWQIVSHEVKLVGSWEFAFSLLTTCHITSCDENCEIFYETIISLKIKNKVPIEQVHGFLLVLLKTPILCGLNKLRQFHEGKLGFQNQLLDLLSKAYSQQYAIKYNILSGDWIKKYMVHNSILYYKNSHQFLELALKFRKKQLKLIFYKLYKLEGV